MTFSKATRPCGANVVSASGPVLDLRLAVQHFLDASADASARATRITSMLTNIKRHQRAHQIVDKGDQLAHLHRAIGDLQPPNQMAPTTPRLSASIMLGMVTATVRAARIVCVHQLVVGRRKARVPRAAPAQRP